MSKTRKKSVEMERTVERSSRHTALLEVTRSTKCGGPVNSKEKGMLRHKNGAYEVFEGVSPWAPSWSGYRRPRDGQREQRARKRACGIDDFGPPLARSASICQSYIA
jgi:hypothetical protein